MCSNPFEKRSAVEHYMKMVARLSVDALAEAWGVSTSTARAKKEGRRPVTLTEMVALWVRLLPEPVLCDACGRSRPQDA